MVLTEAEDIKKRQQAYTDELYKKETVGFGSLKDTDEMNKIDELLAKLIKKKEKESSCCCCCC